MQKIVPAILTKDPDELHAKLRMLKGHTKWVHVDIMDGMFVPNTSLGLFELGEAHQYFNLEIHLMVQDPGKYFEDCRAIGVKRIYFHVEATPDPKAVLEKMKAYPFQRGVAINPPTAPRELAPLIGDMEAVLLLGVNPGFQGQKFIPSVLEKIPEIRKLSRDMRIGVDGGMNEATVTKVFEAGADYAAAGSALMQSEEPIKRLEFLEEMVR
jgi:ribulose-phosphate 3-epimerase